MKKFKLLLWLILIGILPALCFNLILFSHWKIVLLIIAWSFLIFIEPIKNEISIPEKRIEKNYDRIRIAFAGWISLLCPLFIWVYFQPQHQYLTIIGLLLISIGIGMRAWSIRILSKFYSADVKIIDRHKIIKSGPYKLLRHPIYLGSFIFYIGQALFLNTFIGAAVAALTMGYAYAKRITLEEKILIEKFSQSYIDFQKSTWRLIPKIN